MLAHVDPDVVASLSRQHKLRLHWHAGQCSLMRPAGSVAVAGRAKRNNMLGARSTNSMLSRCPSSSADAPTQITATDLRELTLQAQSQRLTVFAMLFAALQLGTFPPERAAASASLMSTCSVITSPTYKLVTSVVVKPERAKIVRGSLLKASPVSRLPHRGCKDHGVMTAAHKLT